MKKITVTCDRCQKKYQVWDWYVEEQRQAGIRGYVCNSCDAELVEMTSDQLKNEELEFLH